MSFESSKLLLRHVFWTLNLANSHGGSPKAPNILSLSTHQWFDATFLWDGYDHLDLSIFDDRPFKSDPALVQSQHVVVRSMSLSHVDQTQGNICFFSFHDL